MSSSSCRSYPPKRRIVSDVKTSRPFHIRRGSGVRQVSMRRVPSSLQLAEKHRAEILAYLVRLLRDVEEARDTCQEVFFNAHRRGGRLRPDSHPPALLVPVPAHPPPR